MSLYKIFALIVCLLGVNYNLLAQFKLDQWEVHTSMYDIKTADIDSEGNIWAAASGGIFMHSSLTDEFNIYRNIDALIDLNINHIEVGPDNSIYVGGVNGYLDIYDGKWHNILDIVSAKFTNPTIKDFLFHDSKVFIAGGFGLTVFDPIEEVFIEDVVRFGDFFNHIDTRKVLFFNGYIWVATESGLARAEYKGSIADRFLWENFTREHGLPDNSVRDLVVFNGNIFGSTERAIFKITSDTIEVVESLQDDIIGLAANSDKLLYYTENDIYELNKGKLSIKTASLINRVFIAEDNRIIIGTQLHGLGIWDGNEINYLVPNSPITNGIGDLSIDENNNLWLAGDETEGRGVMKFDGEKWSNFIVEEIPEMITNRHYMIHADMKGNVFSSSWGQGVFKFKFVDEVLELEQYNSENSPLIGVGDGSYIVPGEIKTDYNGIQWIVNWGANTVGPILVAYDKGTFYDYYNCINVQARNYKALTIDMFGTKWVGSSQGSGLYYFNDNRSLSDESDDDCGVLTTSKYSKLMDNTQNVLVTDIYGMLWIGTDRGLSVLINPSAVLGNSTPIFREVQALSGQKVNDIIIDALNNKWIATTSGVWVLNEDGTELLSEDPIASSNSPLINDEVMDLAYDPETGRIYFGTLDGLFSARSLSIKPRESFDIKCYPQPFSPQTDSEMVIEGLAPDTELKILTINGELVRNIYTKSNKTLWDGLDESGEIVKNGVYLIVGTSNSTDASAVSKIAVVNKR